MLTQCPGYQDKAHNQDTPPLIVAYIVASCMLGTKCIMQEVKLTTISFSLHFESRQGIGATPHLSAVCIFWHKQVPLNQTLFSLSLGSNHRRRAKRKRGALHEPLLSAQLWDTEVDGERRHPGGTVRSSWHCCRYASLFKTERIKEYFQIVSCFRIMILNIQFLDMLLPHFIFSHLLSL